MLSAVADFREGVTHKVFGTFKVPSGFCLFLLLLSVLARFLPCFVFVCWFERFFQSALLELKRRRYIVVKTEKDQHGDKTNFITLGPRASVEWDLARTEALV